MPRVITRALTPIVLLALLASGCSAQPESAAPNRTVPTVPVAGATPPPGTGSGAPSDAPPREPGTVVHGDASTNLDRTPLSAADYAMYAAIMGGASAMLSALTPDDKAALQFATKVDAGTARVTPATERLLAQARAMQEKDVELARLQGIDERYVKVKAKVEVVIGPKAKPPAAGDAVGQENLRYLEAHRATIERLQRILRDPRSKETGGGPVR